jgi:hypothetical protein
MPKEILTAKQIKLLPLVQKFSKEFGLVGGTAIALQIGHRQSIDFDLFCFKEFRNAKIRKIVTGNGYKIMKVSADEAGQFTFYVDGVQFTFLEYPFPIKFTEQFEKFLKMPDLLTLAAMKAYALGRRNKWKDYVDLYFIISKYHSLEKISDRAKKIFGQEFNEKIFREALSYFKDINYEEEVIFLPGFAVNEKKIKKELIKYALNIK